MDDRLIIEYVRMLSISLRRQKSITASDIALIRGLYESGQTTKCIARLKNLCGLKLTILVGRLNGYPNNTEMLRILNESVTRLGYRNFHFVPSDLANLQSSLNARVTPAFVLNPDNLPAIGTREFENFKIVLFIFEWISKYSFETFVATIAHELSHIILNAMRHPLRRNEIAVDLTAMILGFHDIFRIGRLSGHMKLGYLDDHQFQIAYDEIQRQKNIIYL